MLGSPLFFQNENKSKQLLTNCTHYIIVALVFKETIEQVVLENLHGLS